VIGANVQKRRQMLRYATHLSRYGYSSVDAAASVRGVSCGGGFRYGALGSIQEGSRIGRG